MFRRSLLTRSLLGAASVVALNCSIPTESKAVELSQRTFSSSKQFIVYCPDPAARARIASAAEEIKAEVLKLLGEHEGSRKWPIIITLDRATAENASLPPVHFGVYGFEGGFKVGIDVRIGDKPEEINLQRHLVRALLIEYSYRHKPELLRGNETYTEPPWWLVEGAIQLTRRRETGVDTDFFKRLIEVNRLPKIAEFLTNSGAQSGTAAQAIDQACSMCLVQLLVEQPDGRANLARLLRRLPDGQADPVTLLTREFPMFVNGDGLQRWWTLNIARFSAVDRYRGLSPEETDAQLALAIQFDLPTGKAKDEHRTFTLDQFEEYLKIPASRAALLRGQTAMVTLSTQASALYRPVLTEYEQIFALLARGKTRGIKERIEKIEGYRESVLRRTVDISDYLNWFEATQGKQQTDAFDSYLKIASELHAPVRRTDPISQYLDELSDELQPGNPSNWASIP
jgi:hypothetical protein